MSNWYGTCRSNYFRVKDEAAFTEMLSQYEAKLIGKDGKVGFISDDEYGSIPQRYPDDDIDGDPISILDEIAEHLAENSVCVVEEVGAEKARYVTGLAIAIASTGERCRISIGDIYERAQNMFGDTAEITEATY